jgi:diadenosine tetraphosphate (Ap4A) HIT family hydrolase
MPGERVLAKNDLVFAVLDAYPISEGHALFIPYRHVASFLELTPAETSAAFELLRVVREILDARHRPAGYNLGVNVGQAAGQTVMHAHLHLIPRYAGDIPDPVGGIRNVVSGKGRYPMHES